MCRNVSGTCWRPGTSRSWGARFCRLADVKRGARVRPRHSPTRSGARDARAYEGGQQQLRLAPVRLQRRQDHRPDGRPQPPDRRGTTPPPHPICVAGAAASVLATGPDAGGGTRRTGSCSSTRTAHGPTASCSATPTSTPSASSPSSSLSSPQPPPRTTARSSPTPRPSRAEYSRRTGGSLWP